MKFSKQILLSAAMMVGGSVLLYATVHQILQNDDTPTAVQAPDVPVVSQTATNANQPLTVDAATEQRLLVEKQRQREAQVAAQERAAQQYLNEQQRIEAEALARSRAENERYLQRTTNTAAPAASAASDQPAHTTSANQNTNTAATVTRPVITPRRVEVVEVIEPANTAKSEPTPRPSVQANQVKSNPKTEPPKPPQSPPKPSVNAEPAPIVAAASPKPSTQQTADKAASKPNRKPETPKQTETTTASNSARPDQHQVKTGEGLISLARRYDMPTSVLAAANDLPANGQLRAGQTLKIPSQAQVQRLKREAEQEQARKQREAEQKQQQREQFTAAQQKLREARRNVKENDAKGNFGVQVALAADDDRAEAIVKELKAAGYKVKTSQTSRGVRVVVGPETGKEAALALKDKINADPRVDAKNGWVLYW